MQDLVRNFLITLTTVFTSLGFYFKVMDSLIVNIIKIKYNNVPGKKPTFNIVIEFVGFIFLAVYIAFCIISIINSVILIMDGKVSSLINIAMPPQVEGADIATKIFAYCFFGTLGCIYLLCIYVIPMFINKFKGICFYKKSIFIRILIYSGMVMSLLTIVFEGTVTISTLKESIKPVMVNGIWVFENHMNNFDMHNMLSWGLISFISITSFLLLNSIRQIYKEVYSEYMYILQRNSEGIATRCYLEYDEFYLIIQDNSELYIKKSEVKEVKKVKIPYKESEIENDNSNVLFEKIRKILKH